MAHESHAEDTTFIVAEADFRFARDDAHSQMHWWEQQEQVQNKFAHWDEMADMLPETDRAAFRRDLRKLEDACRHDQKRALAQRRGSRPPGRDAELGRMGWRADQLGRARRHRL